MDTLLRAVGVAGIYKGELPDDVKVEFIEGMGETFSVNCERNIWVDIVEYIVNELE